MFHKRHSTRNRSYSRTSFSIPMTEEIYGVCTPHQYTFQNCQCTHESSYHVGRGEFHFAYFYCPRLKSIHPAFPCFFQPHDCIQQGSGIVQQPLQRREPTDNPILPRVGLPPPSNVQGRRETTAHSTPRVRQIALLRSTRR